MGELTTLSAPVASGYLMSITNSSTNTASGGLSVTSYGDVAALQLKSNTAGRQSAIQFSPSTGGNGMSIGRDANNLVRITSSSTIKRQVLLVRRVSLLAALVI